MAKPAVGQRLLLTLLGALVAGVLQRQADGTVVSSAIFPVGDDLPGRRTVSHCNERRTRLKILMPSVIF